jgi:hypothetical protein
MCWHNAGVSISVRPTKWLVVHLFSPTELWGVDCDEQSFHTSLLRVLNDLLGPLSVCVDVQLEELDLARNSGIYELVE